MPNTHNLFAAFVLSVAALACSSSDAPPPQAPPAAGIRPVHHALDSAPKLPPVGKEYLLGKFNPLQHPDFAAVGAPYTDKPGMFLRREALADFERMWADAQKAGVRLKIISSTRTFAQQKQIWEGKWARFSKEAPAPKDRALKILEYSSMPGTSRHHWGTDIDLNDLNNAAFEGTGPHAKAYQWLKEHAHEYGFCQPYTAGRPHGYQEEKWHWSYVPLSIPFLAEYRASVTDAEILGFLGAEWATEIGAVQYYVLGINPDCAGAR
jgi:hypothetical protein